VEGTSQAASLDTLSPDQQEVICSEFLRSETAAQHGLPLLSHLILPLGRTMKDIDILGLAPDLKRIFAQVTYTTFEESEWKLKRLRPYGERGDAHCILFCRADKPVKSDGIHIFPMQVVFEALAASEIGKAWLREATGRT
jgi:hypothetical protein